MNVKEVKVTDKIKSKSYSLQFLPKSIEHLSKTKTVSHNNKNIKTAYLIDIIHSLLLKYYFKKDNIFNLYSVILKEKYGYVYNYCMDYLVDNKFLHILKEYKKGKNARIYKLDEKLITEEIFRFKNNDSRLIDKYKKAVSAIDEENFDNNSILPEIKQKIIMDLFNVDIQYDKALFFLENTKQDTDSYNKNKYSVETIKDKQIFYHFDSYGRVHTNFTILKSFIRKNCLLIDGEETFEYDLNNSQPLLLSKLINEEGIFIDKHEFKIYSRLVLNGEFYQFLMDKTNIKEKKDCKELIYKTLFGKNKQDNNPFGILFPSIYKFIKDYKEIHGNYKILAHKLQNMESEIIFNKIIKTLSIINPDVSVITIHDSLIVQKKHQETLETIFNSVISEEFNFIDKYYSF
jgi:hypothetical protein